MIDHSHPATCICKKCYPSASVIPTSELEALRKDAERYRWIRRQSVHVFRRLYILSLTDNVPFDELVDVAIKGEAK